MGVIVMEKNKTVIVTGASRGIGEAVVQAFLGRGYNVVATSERCRSRILSRHRAWRWWMETLGSNQLPKQ